MGSDPSSGDYGYDLVHEEVGGQAPPAPPSRGGSPPAGDRSGDPAEDLAYDEAHDF
jgi:hypothetical protein